MRPGWNWAKSLTGNKGSTIPDPAWDGAGGFKNGQVVIGERVSPSPVGDFFPCDLGTPRSFGAATGCKDWASGEPPLARNRY
jgi:hypothetical protein